MEKKNNQIIKNQASDISEKKISRRGAIKKAGYVAASTATMMILLNEKAQAEDPYTSAVSIKGNNGIGSGSGDYPPPGNSGDNNNAQNDTDTSDRGNSGDEKNNDNTLPKEGDK